MTAPRQTPAQHRAQAEKDLDALRGHNPGDPAYLGLAMSAAAHVWAAVAAYLEPPPAPSIPGLPDGWRLDTRQSPDGDQMWRYELTSPAGRTETSRHLWRSNKTALGAGLAKAQHLTELAARNGR
jgi:hypothetical protein